MHDEIRKCHHITRYDCSIVIIKCNLFNALCLNNIIHLCYYVIKLPLELSMGWASYK